MKCLFRKKTPMSTNPNSVKIIFQKFENKIDHKIYEYIDVKKSLFRKKTPMSTNPNAVKKNIQKFQKILK
jgi:argininosuccinate lyase